MTKRFVLTGGIVALAALGAAATTVDASEPMSSEWVEKWRADLEYASSEFPRVHADLYHSMTEERFQSELERISMELPTLSHEEAVLQLARLVVEIEDGHSRLTLPYQEGVEFFQGHSTTPPPHVPGLAFGQYPVRYAIYGEDLYVQRVSSQHAEIAGAKVLRMGELDARDAMQAVRSLVHRDNEMQILDLLPSRLVVPEILAFSGVAPREDRVAIEIETVGGERRTVELRPLEPGESVEWVDARAAGVEPPLTFRDNEEHFWVRWLPETRTVYAQYNRCETDGKRDVSDFADEIVETYEREGGERVALDLRHNHGGDNSQNRSLVLRLVSHPEINRPGHLFVLTGRSTFSAAMMLSLDLERWSNAIFVGEPTGSRPIHYGDSRKVTLPETGITVRLSTLYWQYGRPGDDREWIQPHLPVFSSAEDYRLGRDPVLAEVLRDGRVHESSGVAGTWVGGIHLLGDLREMRVRLEEGDAGWTGGVDFPALVDEELPLREVQIDGSSWSGEFPVSEGSIRLAVLGGGERVYGLASRYGLEVPFVLWRP